MIDRICVGVDGSDCARRAATVAIELANPADAHVDVVRVLSAEETAGGDREAEGGWDGDRVLSDVRPSSGDGSTGGGSPSEDTLARTSVDVEGHVREGTPAESIVQFAEDRDADLVVLGRRGLGGVRDRLLGSVVHAVLRTADQSVLTVPDGEGPFDLSNLLVPSDGSDAAERAAPMAATLAAHHDTTVHTCYVLDLATAAGAFSAGGVTEEEIERFEQEGQEHLDRLVDLLHESNPELTVRSAVVRDEPHEGIASAVDEQAIDLVVMSSTGSTSATRQVLGSVTDRVLRTVDVPVLVAKPDRE